MTAAMKVGAFTALLVAVFVLALWTGHTFGSSPDVATPPGDTSQIHRGEHP